MIGANAKMPADDLSVRADMRSKLLTAGIPAAYVDELVDLSFHATDKAIDTIFEVLNRTSDKRIEITAYGITFGLIRARMELMIQALSNVGDQLGIPTKHVTVSGVER